MNRSVSTEQTARNYSMQHPLSRPRICWTRVFCVIVICIVISSFGAFVLRKWIGSFWVNLDILLSLCILLGGKHILLFLVRLYQHYAPERRRRQCCCMPSCSEYAILALNKYVWIKALRLIVRRVTRTCPSPGYKIDYP